MTLTFRPPLLARVVVAACAVGLAGLAGVLAVGAAIDRQVGGMLVGLVVAATTIAMATYVLRRSVHAAGEVLAIRNGFRVERFRRADIVGFHLVDAGGGSSSIAVQDVGGRTVTLRVTQSGPLGIGRTTTKDRLAALEAWHSGG